MDAETWQTEQFEQHRARLRAVAYRMLGSLTDAEDAVQEAWLRLNRTRDESIDNLGGWLTTVVGRVCIDMLRARRTRRENYPGTWLPEPVVNLDENADPEQQALLADSIGLALLVVLETLTPAERLAFVMHDTFGVPFEEIAPVVGRTPAATRQLASRARRRVRGATTTLEPDIAKQREVVAAFLSAARGGDFDALLTLLDPDVVFRSDSGPEVPLAPPLLTGRRAVADLLTARSAQFMPYCEPALVNGAAGLVVRPPGRRHGVIGITVAHGRITEIDLILDPDKLPPL
jgi:RNA polymerase sigma-70 factor (ECF subfamily)